MAHGAGEARGGGSETGLRHSYDPSLAFRQSSGYR